MLASVLWHPSPVHSSPAAPAAASNKPQASQTAQASVALPALATQADVDSVARQVNDHTIAPTHGAGRAVDYTVQKGDSVFGIAKQFNINPDTVLWANYDILNDDPDMLSPGQVLKIPPTDGVYYKVQDGDTLESIAATLNAKLDDILNYSGNKIDLTNPAITPGQYLMVVGGSRAFKQWLIPTIPRGPAGVMKSLLGTGGCDTSNRAVGAAPAFGFGRPITITFRAMIIIPVTWALILLPAWAPRSMPLIPDWWFTPVGLMAVTATSS